MGIFDYFTPEARRGNRQALEGLLMQFIPPEMRPQLNLLAELNPVVSMERAGQDAQQLFAPDQTLMDRLAAGGRMASNMAGVVAPAMVAGRAGVPVANAVQDVLTGYAPMVQPFMADEFGGVPLSGAIDAATQQGSEIINLLRSGRAGEVTEQMLDMGDPVLNARLSEYLYSNYDLPMDTASRMGRRESMGTTEQFYKGMFPYDPETMPIKNYKGVVVEGADRTPREITTIDRPSLFPTFNREDPSEAGYKIAGVMGRDPNIANNFAAWGDSAVYPLDVNLGRTYEMDAAGDRAGVTHFYESGRPFRDAMRSGEYDSGLIKNTSDEGDIAFALLPENIRSRFARFDPRLSHLRNLNAAITAGVPLGLLAMQPGSEPQ